MKVYLFMLAFSFVYAHSEFQQNFLRQIFAPDRLIAFYCNTTKSALGSFIKHYHLAYFQVLLVDVTKGITDDFVKFDRVVFYVNLQCDGVENILDRARRHDMFHRNNVWIFSGTIDQIPLGKYFFSRYSKTFILHQNSSIANINKIFKLTDFSKHFSTVLVYQWSIVKGKLLYSHNGFGTKLISLQQEPIRVSYGLHYNGSVNHMTDYRFRQRDQASKIGYVLVEQICAIFNATHVPIFRMGWGVLHNATQTFTPNKMLSDVAQGLVDLAGNSASFSLSRLKYFRFLSSTGKINKNTLIWFFRAPSLSYSKNIWILPFEKQLWMVIFLFITIWFIAIAIIAKLELKWIPKSTMNEMNSCFVALEIVMTTLTQRGSYITLQTASGKIICYTLFSLYLLLNVAYTANFFVFLQSTAHNIRTFKDVLDSGMKLGSINESYGHHLFMQPNDLTNEPLRKRVYVSIMKNKNSFFRDLDEGIELVKNGKFAYQTLSTIGFDQISKTCDETTKRSIRYVESIVHTNVHLVVPKNSSSLQDFLNYAFQFLYETGIVKKEQKSLYPEKTTLNYLETVFESVEFSDLSFVLFIFLAGMLLSVAILLGEQIHYKIHRTIRENMVSMPH